MKNPGQAGPEAEGGKEPTGMTEEIPVRDGGRVPKVSWTMSLPSVSRIQYLLSPLLVPFSSASVNKTHTGLN